MSSKPEQIVAIGASAGGLEALRPLLARFSYDHAALVIVTHLATGWRSALDELLGARGRFYKRWDLAAGERCIE